MRTTVTIRVRNVGIHFGCVGDLLDRRGRIVDSTATMPYGNRWAAYEAAESLAARKGYTVVEAAS